MAAETAAYAALTRSDDGLARRLVLDEALALLSRLERLEPLALAESAVAAAAPPIRILQRMDRHLALARRKTAAVLQRFVGWIRHGRGRITPVIDVQRRLAILRMRFIATLTDYDVFNDVITQRSERRNGVWLAGLDAVAHDALILPKHYFEPIPLLCYLDRGRGAAIRRLRTRLPGGGENPVAIIRVPRERMLASTLASSLVHEVGHQGCAMLDLVESIRPTLRALQRPGNADRDTWELMERWISEILADLWSVARVGITATVGLIGVLSLPTAFVYRINDADPHPTPWLRVQLSAALGNALYPHAQFDAISRVWRTLYPLTLAPAPVAAVLERLQLLIPSLVGLLVSHRSARTRGDALGDILRSDDRAPAQLVASFRYARAHPDALTTMPPSRALAVLGQARVIGALDSKQEARILDQLLTRWALARAYAQATPAFDN